MESQGQRVFVALETLRQPERVYMGPHAIGQKS